jgi:hypothetical protein
VLGDVLGLSREVLGAVAEQFSGKDLPCAGCRQSMRPLRLHGVAAHLCFHCGALWLVAGALARLSGGRFLESALTEHDEEARSSTPEPALLLFGNNGVDVADREAPVRLGRGSSAVVLGRLQEPPQAALERVFARTDALWSHDAAQLARFTHGVLVEDISAAGASALVNALDDEGIEAYVVDVSVLRVVLPVQVVGLSVEQLASTGPHLRATFAVGPPLVCALSSVVAVVGGHLASSALGVGGDDPSRPVSVVDVVVDSSGPRAVVRRRLRWVSGPAANHHDGAALWHVLASSTVSAGYVLQDGQVRWRTYRAASELDRELAWVLWRRESVQPPSRRAPR